MSQEDIMALMSNYGKVAFEQFLYARFKSNNKGLSKTKKTVYEQVYILTK
jgi:adenine-specific DNA-methyltransferase